MTMPPHALKLLELGAAREEVLLARHYPTASAYWCPSIPPDTIAWIVARRDQYAGILLACLAIRTLDASLIAEERETVDRAISLVEDAVINRLPTFDTHLALTALNVAYKMVGEAIDELFDTICDTDLDQEEAIVMDFWPTEDLHDNLHLLQLALEAAMGEGDRDSRCVADAVSDIVAASAVSGEEREMAILLLAAVPRCPLET